MEATASAADLASNQERQQQLTSVDPDLMKQIGQIGSLSTSYLNGQIPQDVQDQIQRATAQSSLQGGYGGTGMARNLTARDLGLTSMQLQQTGMNMSNTAMNMAGVVNPSFTPVSSLLFSPSQLQARNDQMQYYNTDIKNQEAIIKSNNSMAAQVYAASQQQKSNAATSSDIQSGIKSLFGSSATSGSGGGLVGSLSKLFGGGSSTGIGSTGDISSMDTIPNPDTSSVDTSSLDNLGTLGDESLYMDSFGAGL
jgi:hypothetical protein